MSRFSVLQNRMFPEEQTYITEQYVKYGEYDQSYNNHLFASFSLP